jgi:hypothetical protein
VHATVADEMTEQMVSSLDKLALVGGKKNATAKKLVEANKILVETNKNLQSDNLIDVNDYNHNAPGRESATNCDTGKNA